jgi:hypothetical protein
MSTQRSDDRDNIASWDGTGLPGMRFEFFKRILSGEIPCTQKPQTLEERLAYHLAVAWHAGRLSLTPWCDLAPAHRCAAGCWPLFMNTTRWSPS